MPEPQKAKLWTRDYVLGIAINFFVLLNYYPLMTMMADYAIDMWQVAAGAAGAVASVFILGAVVSRLAAGANIDRIGRKRLLLAGIAIDAVCTALYFVVHSLPVLFALRVVHGFAFGCASTAISTISTSIVPASRKGEGIGYYMLSVTMGSAIGPSIGIAMAQSSNFSAVFIWACACIVVAAVLGVLIHVPAPTGVGGYVTLSGQPATPPKRHGVARVLEPAAVPISVVAGLIFFAYSSLLTYLSQFGQQTNLVWATSLFFIVYALTMFVTRPATGKLFDRRGPRFIMPPAFVAFAAGMVCLGLATQGWQVLVAAVLCGFGVGTLQSSGLTMAVQAAPANNIGMANSTYYAMLDTGVGLGPILFGLFIPYIGIQGIYLAMAIVTLCSMGYFLFLTKRNEH